MPATAMTSVLPALLLALFSTWAGTATGGAGSAATIAGIGALCLAMAWGQPSARLFGPSPAGGFLVLAFFISLGASWWVSPVQRAGRLGVFLLPLCVCLPAFVHRAWPTPNARRRGLAALSLVVAGVAACGLVGEVFLGTPGASLPLGHHNLLAIWLVTLLPLAVLPWREGGWQRVLAGTSGLLALTALARTRSLTGAVALAAIVAVVTVFAGRYRSRRWLLAAAVAVIALQLPRLADLARGADASFQARQLYALAGWQGFLERPWLGWGPGSAAWTLQRFLPAAPGVLPAGETVTEPHLWPLQLAYELGFSGLLLGTGIVVAFVRARRLERVDDRALRDAGLLGLLGAAVASLGGGSVAVLALPVAVLIAAGASLAASTAQPAPRSRWVAALVVATVVLNLLPLALAHRHYDRATRVASVEEQESELRSATHWDREHPLYLARLAWLEAQLDRPAADLARASARAAPGLAPLWLGAGLLGQAEGRDWSRDALVEACRLDPLGAFAPFFLALGEPEHPAAVRWAARALAAEPRLLAARPWVGLEALREPAIARVLAFEGLEPWWLDAFRASARTVVRGEGSVRPLALAMDADTGTALSLLAFRRRPWPVYLAQIELDTAALESITAPSAAAIVTTDPRLFDRRDCLPEPESELAQTSGASRSNAP